MGVIMEKEEEAAEEKGRRRRREEEGGGGGGGGGGMRPKSRNPTQRCGEIILNILNPGEGGPGVRIPPDALPRIEII